MLLNQALQIAPCGLTQVWRIGLLDETTKPRGSFKDVSA
jgi:hypothetical protein